MSKEENTNVNGGADAPAEDNNNKAEPQAKAAPKQQAAPKDAPKAAPKDAPKAAPKQKLPPEPKTPFVRLACPHCGKIWRVTANGTYGCTCGGAFHCDEFPSDPPAGEYAEDVLAWLSADMGLKSVPPSVVAALNEDAWLTRLLGVNFNGSWPLEICDALEKIGAEVTDFYIRALFQDVPGWVKRLKEHERGLVALKTNRGWRWVGVRSWNGKLVFATSLDLDIKKIVEGDRLPQIFLKIERSGTVLHCPREDKDCPKQKLNW